MNYAKCAAILFALSVSLACGCGGDTPSEPDTPPADASSDAPTDGSGDGSSDASGDASSCPPADEPTAYGQSCTGDGECGGYLDCAEFSCGWPPAMTGEHDETTAQITIESDGTSPTSLEVELARTELERSRGLANRPCIQSDWGMLFVHPDEEALTYTVEEMQFALDIVFADTEGSIVAMQLGLEPGESGVIHSGVVAKYALELRAGQVAALGIGVEDRIVVGDWDL